MIIDDLFRFDNQLDFQKRLGKNVSLRVCCNTGVYGKVFYCYFESKSNYKSTFLKKNDIEQSLMIIVRFIEMFTINNYRFRKKLFLSLNYYQVKYI